MVFTRKGLLRLPVWLDVLQVVDVAFMNKKSLFPVA